jgi:16S rRNA (cytidine1402-2'-O)-methyltransferase
MPGTLYLVATPIGNLEDISFRAVRVLGEAALIACEDTRHSRHLLDHYQIRRPLVSYHRLNEAERGGELLDRLLAGESVALITDAGTPLISDPGARLIERALAVGVNVVPIPGPSALTTALMAAGVSEPVTFIGFLPARAGERQRALEQWALQPAALVMFEAPHRILDALEAIAAVCGPERPLTVCRELTKLHEEILRGPVATLHAQLAGRWQSTPPRGELTLVLAPPSAPSPTSPADLETALAAITHKDELKPLARSTGLPRGELYRRWQQLRGKMTVDRG